MIRAFHHPEQGAYSPSQSMRYGRVVAARDHGERTARLLDALGRLGIAAERPRDHGVEPVLAVHDAAYLDFLRTVWEQWSALPEHGPEVWPNYFPYENGRLGETARRPCPTRHLAGRIGWYLGDLSAPLGPGTWLSALRSAETAVSAADAVGEETPVVYALCRPSGHHARADRAAGACYLNNAAIAAHRLAGRYRRIAILDIDVHHGDGTQQLFYGRDDVLTLSIHADPRDAYPFYTGHADERGRDAGLGCNLNLPLAIGADGRAFGDALSTAEAAIAAFAPDALILAAGFDAHRADPVRLLGLDAADFAMAGALLRRFGLPALVVQEGGYALDAIGDCLEALLGAAV